MRGGEEHRADFALSRREQRSRGRRTTRYPERRARIKESLAAGPLSVKALSRRVSIEYRLLSFYLNPLIEEGSVVVIGLARDAGITDCHPLCKVVALPGTPRLAPYQGPRVKHSYGPKPKAAPTRRASSEPIASGEFAIAGWRTIGRGLAGWGRGHR